MRRAAVALIGLLFLAGCGDDPQPAADRPSGEATAAPVGKPNQGSIVQFADCKNWNSGTDDEKRATVVALRRQLTAESSQTADSPLDDERAFEILQSSCAPSYAGSLRLYKLYVRAQAFAPLTNE